MNEKIILSNPLTNRKPPYTIASIDSAIEAIRKQLTPDLLKPEYRENSPHPMFGHCYVATETLWHLTGQRLKIYRARDTEGIVHWWLQDNLGNRYDPTYDQYTDLGKTPPYDKGKASGFLTGAKPSKRTQTLMKRIV